MKKSKTSPLSLLFSALLAAVIFYFATEMLFKHFFGGFDLYSSQHWHHILAKWKNGFVLRTTKEYLFFTALIALLPGYFVLWFAVCRFPFAKVLMAPTDYFRNRKKKELEARSLAAAVGPLDKKENKPKEPAKKIRISAENLNRINQLRGKTDPAAARKESHQEEKTEQRSIPVISRRNDADEPVDLWDNMVENLEKGGVFVLRQMKITSVPFDVVAITQNALFLICAGPEGSSVWKTADEASPAVWKTEKGEIPSPVIPMINAKKALQDYLKEHFPEYAALTVYCCMILDHGHISNTDVFIPFLERNDISVLRAGSCQTEALPASDALIGLIGAQPESSKELNDAVALSILDLMEA